MRIVLLGNRNAGKSSSGNTILGTEVFGTSGRTAECVKRDRETAGRHITVVEAPGWWNNYTLKQTPERDKREILLSVSLCPPGPHALLLVINVCHSFTEIDKRAVQEHLELLGERVWSHTMVLFTWGDWLGNTTVEQHIENGGESLKWVVEKCGNRYHVVENKKSDGGRVTELLEKIEEMVARNRGHHFDFDAKILEGLKDKKKEEKRRAEEKKMKVKKQREIQRSSPAGVHRIIDMRIVLLGHRKAGKSLSGNTILGSVKFNPSRKTAECVQREGQASGRQITVVEAPGWWKNYTVGQTPEQDKHQIVLSVSLCPHALLLATDVSKSFTETHRRAVQEHLELLGERVWSHTIVLFTRGDWLGDTTIEQHIESEGEALKWVVEKCGNRYHVVNNNKRDGGQVTELLEKIEEMMAGNSGCLFQINKSMENIVQFKDHSGTSGYGSFESGLESELVRSCEHAGVTFQTVIQRTNTQGGGESGEGEQDLTLTPEQGKSPPAKTQYTSTKGAFVDASTITVNYSLCIGRGSYGVVYRGTHQGTPAAVKIIAIGDTSVITNEFLIPLRLSHPNIVRMMAVAKTETQILIANEYIHGANLQQVLHTDTSIKLDYEDKLFVALDVAMALEYIHGKNIMHQDLKPANIMIAEKDKKASLMDWGMANWKETILTTTGSHHKDGQCGPQGGTPPYMAPECLVDCEDCSTLSDMWSFGITLLEMFTNSAPWTYTKVSELRRFLSKEQAPHALAKLQPPADAIVKPLLEYEPKSRINAKDLVILLKSKVDLNKRYGYTW